MPVKLGSLYTKANITNIDSKPLEVCKPQLIEVGASKWKPARLLFESEIISLHLREDGSLGITVIYRGKNGKIHLEKVDLENSS